MTDGEHTAVYHLPNGETCETKEELAKRLVDTTIENVERQTGMSVTNENGRLVDDAVCRGIMDALDDMGLQES